MKDLAIYGPLNTTATGPSQVTRGLVNGLDSVGYDVTLYTTGDDTHSRAKTVTVPGSVDSVPNFIRTKRRVARVVKANDHDIFHTLPGLIDGADIATVQGICADLQMLRWAPHIIEPREFIGANIYSVLKALGYHRTDTVIAISPLVANQSKTYIRRPVDGVISLGVDSDLRTPPERSDESRVLIPGKVAPIKGQHRILKHLDPDDDRYTVDIVGKVTDERYARKFEDRWADRLHGYVDDIDEYFEAADIVLLPSEHDNFPTTAVEAIGRGCVVLITDTCGFATFESVKSCPGVRVVSNGREMADAFERLLDTDIFDLKQASYDLSAEMTWERVAEQYHEIYQEL